MSLSKLVRDEELRGHLSLSDRKIIRPREEGEEAEREAEREKRSKNTTASRPSFL